MAVDAALPDAAVGSLEDEGALEGLSKKKDDKKGEVGDSPNTEKVLRRSTRTQKPQPKPTRAKSASQSELLIKAVQNVAAQDLPTYAVVRHFHVDRVYQQAGVHYDLARSVIEDIFASSSSPLEKGRRQRQQALDKILVRVSSVHPEGETMWRRLGFKEISSSSQDSDSSSSGTEVRKSGKFKVTDSLVIFGEYQCWLEMTRERWEKVERHNTAYGTSADL